MEDNTVLEEKQVKVAATKEVYTMRLSPETKKNLLDEITRLGWKNSEVADNLLMLLKKDYAAASVEVEYDKLYKAFVANSERGIALFQGVLAQSKENVARAVDAQKGVLASRDLTIADLQAKAMQLGKDLDKITANMQEVILEKDKLCQEIARLQSVIADKDAVIAAKEAELNANTEMLSVLQSVKAMLGNRSVNDSVERK